MADNCPFCGCNEREHEKRKFDCGTWKSATGTINQSTPCKMIAVHVEARNKAEADEERACTARDAARRAQADAERERDNAIEAAKDPVAQLERFRYALRSKLVPEISELVLNVEVQTPGPD